jgi:hypothetical protein
MKMHQDAASVIDAGKIAARLDRLSPTRTVEWNKTLVTVLNVVKLDKSLRRRVAIGPGL